MITIGLDFGTHQSKVCIERREGAELSYEFFTFNDVDGNTNFTLPSIIHIDSHMHLNYGFLPNHLSKGKIIRYFKQATFTSVSQHMEQKDAINYSIWYVAYILFHIEERFGQDFAIQMGVPADNQSFDFQKKLAVRILLSAYRLVEEVYKNDIEKFLASSLDELTANTEFLLYNKDQKEEYNILVFPEAYACLMPLISSAKIATGMSLMVDIGGGTTDISFFTTENKRPQVYKFYSINKGLNFLTNADSENDFRRDSNVKEYDEIDPKKIEEFTKDIRNICNGLRENLKWEFKAQCNLSTHRLTDALTARPIIYSGGGSTFEELRQEYLGFKDIIHVSENEWRSEVMKDMNRITALKLCPILSTAYGLSISVVDDDIKCKPFQDIFEEARKWNQDKSQNESYTYGKSISSDGFNYADDWDAVK